MEKVWNSIKRFGKKYRIRSGIYKGCQKKKKLIKLTNFFELFHDK